MRVIWSPNHPAMSVAPNTSPSPDTPVRGHVRPDSHFAARANGETQFWAVALLAGKLGNGAAKKIGVQKSFGVRLSRITF